MIKIGSPAPLFSMPDQNNNDVSLASYLGRNVVIFFYPKNFTPGCTDEVCAFRDEYSEFKRYNAELIGISSDNSGSHREFAEKYHLAYTLLSDTNGEVAKLWGVKKTLGLFAGRETFVIDSEGITRFHFSSQLRAREHASQAIAAVKEIALAP